MPVKLVGNKVMARTQGQQGQVLAVGLLFMGLLLLVLVRFFYVGLVNIELSRQRHALDAATYSGALMQAQALNYASYINRAYAGHQLAMAHLLAMASWAHFAGTEAMRVQRANPPASVIAMMFGPQHGAAYKAATLAEGAQQYAAFNAALGRAFQQHDAFGITHLQPASELIYEQLPQWREQVIRQVLQDNYPEYPFTIKSSHIELEITEDNWHESVGWQQADSLRPWLQQLVQHYAFLNDRNQTARNNWVVDPRCPARRHELRRRGKTELDEQGLWRSEDTQSYHALRSNRWIGCYFREYPMGWAWVPSQSKQQLSSETSTETVRDFGQQDFWRWVQEHTNWNIFTGSTNALANAWAKADQVQWQGRGLSPYLNVGQKNAVIGFQTRLTIDPIKQQRMTSFSGAETYFVRPTTRSDQKPESSNLFHAFWQARLQHKPWQQRLEELLGG